MQSPLKMKKIEIKDLGLIKRANFELKKVNILIGECYKTEILEIIYNLYTLERKYFEFKLKVNSGIVPKEDSDFCKVYKEFVNILQKDIKLSDSGYIKYDTDSLSVLITKDDIKILQEKIEPPDSYFWNTSPFFPLNRDQFTSISNLDNPTELFDVNNVVIEILNYVISEHTTSGYRDSELVPLMFLRDWGYDDFIRLQQSTGKFCRYRKTPESILPLSNGLQYLAPICLVLDYLKDRLVNGIYIDLPEHGLFPPITQLLIRNLIDDYVFRESIAEDKEEGEDYSPLLCITTNSELVINTILEYKKLQNNVSIIPITEIQSEPLLYNVFNTSEENIDSIYNGLDAFYNINSL